MPSFYGIQLMRTGLAAQQRALNTVGHNVANAATKGYSRREVSMITAEPEHVLRQSGSGIRDVDILRYRDDFLDKQFRSKSGAFGYQQARSGALQHVETALGDLSETGLRGAMDKFFTSWDTLANSPNDPDARLGVVTATQSFLDQAKGVHRDLLNMREALVEDVQTRLDLINQAARQVAEMNKQIRLGEINPEQHEIMDQRDRIIDSLSHMAGVTTTRLSNGTLELHLGSMPLVDREFAHTLSTTVNATGNLELHWSGAPSLVIPAAGGELKALMEVRDDRIPAYINYLDNLVKGVATQVNTLHDDPLTPLPEEFFTITPGQPLGVEINASIRADHQLIRVGNGAAGDGTVARAIARLQNTAFMTGAPTTPSGGAPMVKPGDYLRSISSALGLEVQDAAQRAELAGIQVDQAETYRQSVSGVSLDDEMTKMMQFQQAYNAAARVMTSMDELLDVVVNRVGLTGR